MSEVVEQAPLRYMRRLVKSLITQGHTENQAIREELARLEARINE